MYRVHCILEKQTEQRYVWWGIGHANRRNLSRGGGITLLLINLHIVTWFVESHLTLVRQNQQAETTAMKKDAFVLSRREAERGRERWASRFWREQVKRWGDQQEKEGYSSSCLRLRSGSSRLQWCSSEFGRRCIHCMCRSSRGWKIDVLKSRLDVLKSRSGSIMRYRSFITQSLCWWPLLPLVWVQPVSSDK